VIHGVGDASTTSFPASKHPLYWRWVNMIGRCYNPKHCQYKSYGAKGIYVEQQLLNFAEYVKLVSSLPNYDNLLCDPEKWDIDKDMKGGKCYSKETLSIVRKAKNVKIENQKKKRLVGMYSLCGEKLEAFNSVGEAELKTGISRGGISRSARKGCCAGGYKWRYLDASD